MQVSWEIDDRGWVRLALWDGAILPPMMSPGSSLTKFWRALQPLIPFKGSGEYSCEDSRHPPVIHFILLLHQSFARWPVNGTCTAWYHSISIYSHQFSPGSKVRYGKKSFKESNHVISPPFRDFKPLILNL
jgi:hypothetical protein